MSHMFIQWKGTDVCMDFECPNCGHDDHIDGFFCHHIKCGACKTVYQLGTEVSLNKVDKEPENGVITTVAEGESNG